MTPEVAICLLILACAVLLFAFERVPADVVALGVMLALIVTGLLGVDQAFAGFASETVMMILGLLIMTAGLAHTGIVDAAGRRILEYAGRNPKLLIPAIMLSVAVLSAFMSNTAATAFFIPVVLGFTARTGTSASRYLLPLAFASILTSSVTLISTSTNIVVSELMTRSGLSPMGMFELAPVGIPIAVVGLLYMWLIGVRLMPRHVDDQDSSDVGHRRYQADVVVLPESPLIEQLVADTPLEESSGLTVVKVAHKDGSISDHRRAKLVAGDVLVIEGLRADILKIKGLKGLDLKADVHLADPDAEPHDQQIVEAVLLPRSPLIGRTLKSAEFHDRYGLEVLGINRSGVTIPRKLSDIRLKLGDVLLLQGTAENVRALQRGNLFNIFGGVERTGLNVRRARIAMTIFAASLAAGTFKLVPLSVAVLAGAFLMLATRCISPEEAYRQVEWKAVVLIGALLSLGMAMDATGTGKLLAEQLIAVLGAHNPNALLASFFLLTVVLTQPMSNQAAAIVVLPIAIETARQLGLDPRSFAMMVAVAASCSYLTPLEPSCLLVYGPGKYRFADFFKVGLPLTFIIFGMAILLVPRVWPPVGS
jgi:di/tricarboxylate transporter